MALCIRDAFHESRSLELERKVGGNFHLRLLINATPIANKYHEGIVKMTWKRGLKVLEIAELEAKDVWVAMIDCCNCRLLCVDVTCKRAGGAMQL